MEIFPYKDNNFRAAKVTASGMFLEGSKKYGYYKITKMNTV